MITKNISTEQGDVSSVVEIIPTDNGQIVLNVVSTLGSAKHEHRVTVGSDDGADAVSDMTDEELTASLQSTLDTVRADAAVILSGRARVSSIVTSLK